MEHPLVLVNDYMTLITQDFSTIKIPDIHFFEELHVYNHLQKLMVGVEGVTVRINTEYFSHEGMIEDVAFLVESLQDLQDNAALGHIIHFIADSTQENPEEFISQVVAKVREYSMIEKELADKE